MRLEHGIKKEEMERLLANGKMGKVVRFFFPDSDYTLVIIFYFCD